MVAFIAAIGLTGCPHAQDFFKSFGKDDLYGTWMTLEFDESGNRKDYYINTENNEPYVVTWKFDGKSENMFNGNGGNFWQHLIHYDSVTDNLDGTYTFGKKVKETFWYGEYAIKGNSGYSKGKLYLYYECGYEFPLTSAGALDTSDANYVDLETLKTWKVNDFLTKAELSGLTDEKLVNNTLPGSTGEEYYNANKVTIQIREVDGKKQCSDIEYFRFNLEDGSASGYTRLMATIKDKNGTSNVGGIYNQWATENKNGQSGKFDGGWKVYAGNSWSGQSTRYMGRISVTSTPENPDWLYSDTRSNNDLFKLVDASDSTDYADPDADVRAEQ
ncbi:MAG: hypothetical protein J6S91_14195 [Treponema sp.]|nr:hypothetical protein [Treponema sp.]